MLYHVSLTLYKILEERAHRCFFFAYITWQRLYKALISRK